MSLLLKNLSYLNIEEEKIYENYDIYIQDNIIKQIGKDLKLEAEEIINCDNKLALPAFTNAHSHLGMTMMRNLADDLDLDTWLNKKIFPIEDKLSEEDIYYASLLSIIENIKSGVSSVCDMYYSLDKVSEAIIESGVRGFLSRGLMDIAGGGKERLDEVKWLYSTYHNAGNNRVKIIPGPHSIYTCSKEYLKEILELSKDMDGVLNIHLSETLKEVKDSIKNFGLSPAYYLDSIGYFDVKLIAAHCTHLSDLEIDFVSDKDFYPIYNPTSNLKLASGFTNIQKMLDKNIIVGLGTDGSSSNNNQDLVEEMHIGSIVNKALNKNPESVKAIEILKMVTKNGAEIMGIEAGKIKEGYLADINLFNLNSISFTPKNNLISALCYSAKSTDVSDLIVDGKIIMRDREVLTLDEEKIKYKVRELTKKLLNR